METFGPHRENQGLFLPQFVLDTQITFGAKIMYALLCDFASDTDRCWPSQATLASRLSCCLTSVKKYLTELVNAKLITVRHEQYRSSVYYMMRPPVLQEAKAANHKTETVQPQPKVVHRQPENGCLKNLKKQRDNTPPPLPPVPVLRRLPPASRPMGGGGFSLQDFEKLWDAYPKKDARGIALHAFKQLGRGGLLPPFAELLAAINRFLATEQWKRENGRFIPQLSNFLRGHRWLDPLSPEEEQAVRQRQETERAALARQREQEADEARKTAKRLLLRPIYDAFTEQFGDEARHFSEGVASMHFGLWMHLYGKYGGPTAADVQDGNTLTILDFMKAYQQRRDEEAYRAALAARDSQSTKLERTLRHDPAMPEDSALRAAA